jgi:hypothetical protein
MSVPSIRDLQKPPVSQITRVPNALRFAKDLREALTLQAITPRDRAKKEGRSGAAPLQVRDSGYSAPPLKRRMTIPVEIQ